MAGGAVEVLPVVSPICPLPLLTTHPPPEWVLRSAPVWVLRSGSLLLFFSRGDGSNQYSIGTSDCCSLIM